MSTVAQRLRELADDLDDVKSSHMAAIAGADLKPGDVFLPRVGSRMEVQAIEPTQFDGLMKALGTETAGLEVYENWSETFRIDDWVVVER